LAKTAMFVWTGAMMQVLWKARLYTGRGAMAQPRKWRRTRLARTAAKPASEVKPHGLNAFGRGWNAPACISRYATTKGLIT
jgi:hypothetical protein